MKRRVMDCFSFFNELDVLEVRLETLDPFVDYFIINEGMLTFNGTPKPLYYQENKERYKKFWNKIIYHLIDDYPTETGNLPFDESKGLAYNRSISMCNKADWFPKNYLPYFRDTWTKESLFYSMPEYCQPEDIIMLSDADEIPSQSALDMVLSNFSSGEVYNLNQNWYHYYFNLRKKQSWLGNIILDYNNFLSVGMCELKMKRRGVTVADGGWHFSYVGNFDSIMEKLDSGQEHTWNVPMFKDNLKDSIDNALTCGHDLHFWASEFEVVGIDTMPKYIIDNKEKFSKYIK